MATTRIKDLSKTATTVNSDANLVLDGNTGGTQKISRDNFRQDTADAFVAAPGTYNLAPLNSGTGKIDAVYLSSTSDSPKGAWNASTNTPTLADGSGTAGDYYDVTVAGSSDLGSGSIAFTVGDVVKYNGTVWFKIDSVANILDGVSTIDGAKTAIEIPDVGTDPSQVPLNQHLGSLAYQSAESVSIASAEVETLEVTDKVGVGITPSHPLEVFGNSYLIGASSSVIGNNDAANYSIGDSSGVQQNKWYGGHEWYTLGNNLRMKLDSSGNVGIGTASPSSYSASADDLVVGNSSTATASGATIATVGGGVGSLYFADGTSGDQAYRGRVQYNHSYEELSLGAAGGVRLKIAGSTGNVTINNGNLVIGTSGKGIDFGSGDILDDYQEGGWTPSLSTGAGESITYASQDGGYTKIGREVFCTGKIQINTAATYGSGTHLQITGLPFTTIDQYDHVSFNYGGTYNFNSLFQVGDITGAQATSNGGSSIWLQRGAYGGTSDVYYRTALLNTTGFLMFSLRYKTSE